MYYPVFEYSLMVYLCLDFVVTTLAYKRGELSEWFWKFSKIVFPLNILLCSQFRKYGVLLSLLLTTNYESTLNLHYFLKLFYKRYDICLHRVRSSPAAHCRILVSPGCFDLGSNSEHPLHYLQRAGLRLPRWN